MITKFNFSNCSRSVIRTPVNITALWNCLCACEMHKGFAGGGDRIYFRVFPVLAIFIPYSFSVPHGIKSHS